MSLEINIEELRKTKNYEEIAEIAEKLMDEVERFQGHTKAELIRLMADKLEEAGYPILEIREKIQERLGLRVTRQYLLMCLDDRFKNPKRVAAGKAIREAEKQTNTGASGSSTVMEEPGFESDNDDNDDNKTEADIPDSEYLARKNWESPDTESVKYSDEYIEKLEQLQQQVKALKGELNYNDMLSTVRILKLNKATLNRLDNASAASKVYTYLLVDIRTNEAREIYSDVEWKKKLKQQQNTES